MKAFSLLLGDDKKQACEVTCTLLPSTKNRAIIEPVEPTLALRQSANYAVKAFFGLLGASGTIGHEFDLYFYFQDIEPDLPIEGGSAGLLFALLGCARVYEYLTGEKLTCALAATGVITEPDPGARIGKVSKFKNKLQAIQGIRKLLSAEDNKKFERVKVFYPQDNESDFSQVADGNGFEFIPVTSIEHAVTELLGKEGIEKLTKLGLTISPHETVRPPIMHNNNSRSWLGLSRILPMATLLIFFAFLGRIGVSRLRPDPAESTVASRGLSANSDQTSGVSHTPPAILSSLVLSSDSQVTILVDDRLEGENIQTDPIAVSVSEGRHTVIFRHPNYGDATFEVSVTAGRQVSYSCHYNSTIAINSFAEGGDFQTALIKINGKPTGLHTPNTVTRGPGTYRVAVHRFGYEAIEGVKEIEIRPTLQNNKHTVVFTLREL